MHRMHDFFCGTTPIYPMDLTSFSLIGQFKGVTRNPVPVPTPGCSQQLTVRKSTPQTAGTGETILRNRPFLLGF